MAAALRFALCSLLLGSSCKRSGADDEERPTIQRVDEQGRVVLSAQERQALDLETAPAAQGTLSMSSLRFGRVLARPEEESLLVAPIAGRLLAPPLALGAQVSRGDVIARLEPLVDSASRASLEAQRRELQGQIAGGRAQVEARRSELRRASSLAASGLATEAEQAQAQAALTSEQARVESLKQASTELARATGGQLELRAPEAGVVVALESGTGSLIAQGSLLVRILRSGPRWIDLAVPPQDPIGSGYRVEVGSELAEAKLLGRGAIIQADGTRRDRLEVAAEAAAELLPGATVSVEVLHATSGVLVPAQAILRRGRAALVFVEAEQGRYEARRVQVAARDDAQGVTSGVLAGERVVTRGGASLLGELGAAQAGPGPGEPE
jgi:RND family efflux transporter MFP subunit